MNEKRQARRTFLERCLSALGAFGLLGVFYPVLRYLEPPANATGADRVEIDQAELPPGGGKMVIYRGRPTLVVNGPDGFVAYNAVCSHLGCVVKWMENSQAFVCPCHGGKFDVTGRVVGGPPPRPLVAVDVTVSEDRVIVGG